MASVALALAAAGCGSGKRRAPNAGAPTRASAAACSASAKRAMATFAGRRPISAVAYSAPDGSHGCRLRAAATDTASIVVVVQVDTLPQPLARLDRLAVETTQNALWSHSRAVPRAIANLGQAAWWIPADSRLLAGGRQRLVSVTVTWRGARPIRRLAVAEALARTYLGP